MPTTKPEAELILHCCDLDQSLDFYTSELGFKLAIIFPADAPEVAILNAYGLTIRLQKDGLIDRTCLRITTADREQCKLQAPNGTNFEFVHNNNELNLPPGIQKFVLSQLDNNTHWHPGRAGMRYRDLIPERHGGRFIASHIHIPDAGPVADYVHYHKIRFQMIYCYKGWVKVVYEGQGEPFILQAGDCVLQPPLIRHQVLESSKNLEVIEIGCPAEHLTYADREMTLPTPESYRQQEYTGQNFVRHQSAKAHWQNWRLPGFEMRDIGIATATKGLAGAYVVRPLASGFLPVEVSHQEEFLFLFALTGSIQLNTAGQAHTLSAGSACVIPADTAHSLSAVSADFEMLEVRLAADFKQLVNSI